jgi:hypothetical protein
MIGLNCVFVDIVNSKAELIGDAGIINVCIAEATVVNVTLIRRYKLVPGTSARGLPVPTETPLVMLE